MENVTHKFVLGNNYCYKLRSPLHRMIDRLIAWQRGRKRDVYDYHILQSRLRELCDHTGNSATQMPLHISAHEARLIMRRLPRNSRRRAMWF